VVSLPLLAVAVAVALFWQHGIGWFDLALAALFYVVTGHGITLGFHRLFTHRSFRANRWLRIGLAVAGSMAVEGSLASWVANHRRHHVFSDREGDPHSPHGHGAGSGIAGQLRGLLHAHVGWLFTATSSSTARWSKDLLADRDMVIVSALTPLWIALSLALPFAIGWAVTQSLLGACLALIWAGGVRIALLQHVTWSVNSLCHVFGARPYRSQDFSGNMSSLALVSFGDAWHNNHHAFPAAARHGADRGQLDTSATLLRVFERLGWAWQVRWPTARQLATRRLTP
jgi:stearoyl-CoA desaturase (delta-9 desaturase)